MQKVKNLLESKNGAQASLNLAYRVPKQYVDCRKILQSKLKNTPGHVTKQLTTQQKRKFKRVFYLDETIKTFNNTPSPSTYLQNFSTLKKYKSLNTFKVKFQQKLAQGKRPTWIQDIQQYQHKHNYPSVGKYNLLTKSDFIIKKKSKSMQKVLKQGQKRNILDGVQYHSAQIPGPGAHNPHKSISKLRVNILTRKDFIKKNSEQEKRTKKKLNTSNLSSCSYSPTKYQTFDAISKQQKKKDTLMKINKIDKRMGRSSSSKSPGPGSYQIINKWENQTFHKEKILGKLQILNKTTRSFPTLRVYN